MSKSIALLHFAAPPGTGGVELTMLHHARILAAERHAVRVIAGAGRPLEPDVQYVFDPLFGSRGAALDQLSRQLAAGTAGPEFERHVGAVAAALAEALAGVDILMAHNVLSLHKNLALTAALHRLHMAGDGPRILAWCHDFAWLDPLYIPEMHDGWPWDLLRRPWPGVAYVAVSRDRRGRLARLLGIPEREVAVVPPGVDLRSFTKLEDHTLAIVQRHRLLEADPLLLLPARITRRKNIELAIAVAGGLRGLGLAPRLVVTGPPGPHNPTNARYLELLESIQRDSGAGESVLFLYRAYADAEGRPLPVSDAMVADWYRLADALLFTSRDEGFGIPILEALQARLPIFCADIPPFRETADGAATFFDPRGDPVAIAATIAETLRADEYYRRRRAVRLSYTWEALYRECMLPLLSASNQL